MSHNPSASHRWRSAPPLTQGRRFFATVKSIAFHPPQVVYHPLQRSGISPTTKLVVLYSFRCKAPLCFALRALLGFSERTEEQSALARLCKHRLSSLDFHPCQKNGISSRLYCCIILLSVQSTFVLCASRSARLLRAHRGAICARSLVQAQTLFA